MPRPVLPPTPNSSSEIRGKDNGKSDALQMSFELPPPAIAATDSRSSSASAKSSSASSYHPTSPKSPTMSISSFQLTGHRRCSTTVAPSKDVFALPPPPTRSRKIIQMKPRGLPEETLGVDGSVGKPGASKGAGSAAQTKKKQPSATSVAGRKIARKTAHSLIERRRRSKMNEEFGVLKNMIPACTGEMHKLAILQASIDYVRYLEDCVAQLKAQNNPTPASGPDFKQPFTAPEPYKPSARYDSYDDEDEASDVEMLGSEDPSPSYSPQPKPPAAQQHQSSVSPALLAQDSRLRHNSYSSAVNEQRHYSYSASATTSPAFGPQPYEYAVSTTSANSTLTSPTLLPQRDRNLDQEATAALLMLNTDRRGTSSSASGRGMSVRDLLTT